VWQSYYDEDKTMDATMVDMINGEEDTQTQHAIEGGTQTQHDAKQCAT
jgi:hypothetical protein